MTWHQSGTERIRERSLHDRIESFILGLVGTLVALALVACVPAALVAIVVGLLFGDSATLPTLVIAAVVFAVVALRNGWPT